MDFLSLSNPFGWPDPQQKQSSDFHNHNMCSHLFFQYVLSVSYSLRWWIYHVIDRFRYCLDIKPHFHLSKSLIFLLCKILPSMDSGHAWYVFFCSSVCLISKINRVNFSFPQGVREMKTGRSWMKKSINARKCVNEMNKYTRDSVENEVNIEV